jgi:AcrR family transcriptional regulator
VQLFGERGVDVRLGESAAASGIGSATLHRQFRGRVELVHSVLDTQADRLAARAAERLSSGCPEQALRAWLLEVDTASRLADVVMDGFRVQPTCDLRCP